MDSQNPQILVRSKSQGAAWCCIHRPLPSSPLTAIYRTASADVFKQQQNNKPQKNDDKKSVKHRGRKQKPHSTLASSAEKHQEAAAYNKSENGKKAGSKCSKSVGETLRTGEIAALIKQGFIGGMDLVDKSCEVSNLDSRPNGGIASSALASESPPKYANFRSFLNDGVMNESSPLSSSKNPSTLYDMIIHDQEAQKRALQTGHTPGGHSSAPSQGKTSSSFDSQATQFNDPITCDSKVILKNRDGTSTFTVHAHRKILSIHSKFFEAKFKDVEHSELPHIIEISECDNVEMYLETLRLMYSGDIKKALVKETVPRVLGILKVCAGISFQAGIASCLEYLEAVPWAEDDEEKVASLLMELRLENTGAGEVLQRLSTTDPTELKDVLVSLLHLVTKGTDEKARREMKILVSRMLRENTVQGTRSIDLSKDSLYDSCCGCMKLLLELFIQASNPDVVGKMGEERSIVIAQITRQADNLNWLVEILIDRQIADEFVKIWAFQTELATLHRQVPIMFGRYEVSRLTAGLCIALGKGQVLAPKEVRFMLLQNWLQPLIDDFGWMQRACKGLDRKVVEEGISQTILTLPLKQQQTMMLAWFDRFLKNGDDCPNLQRAFETWWRRTFIRTPMEAVFPPEVHP